MQKIVQKHPRIVMSSVFFLLVRIAVKFIRHHDPHFEKCCVTGFMCRSDHPHPTPEEDRALRYMVEL